MKEVIKTLEVEYPVSIISLYRPISRAFNTKDKHRGVIGTFSCKCGNKGYFYNFYKRSDFFCTKCNNPYLSTTTGKGSRPEVLFSSKDDEDAMFSTHSDFYNRFNADELKKLNEEVKSKEFPTKPIINIDYNTNSIKVDYSEASIQYRTESEIPKNIKSIPSTAKIIIKHVKFSGKIDKLKLPETLTGFEELNIARIVFEQKYGAEEADAFENELKLQFINNDSTYFYSIHGQYTCEYFRKNAWLSTRGDVRSLVDSSYIQVVKDITPSTKIVTTKTHKLLGIGKALYKQIPSLALILARSYTKSPYDKKLDSNVNFDMHITSYGSEYTIPDVEIKNNRISEAQSTKVIDSIFRINQETIDAFKAPDANERFIMHNKYTIYATILRLMSGYEMTEKQMVDVIKGYISLIENLITTTKKKLAEIIPLLYFESDEEKLKPQTHQVLKNRLASMVKVALGDDSGSMDNQFKNYVQLIAVNKYKISSLNNYIINNAITYFDKVKECMTYTGEDGVLISRKKELANIISGINVNYAYSVSLSSLLDSLAAPTKDILTYLPDIITMSKAVNIPVEKYPANIARYHDYITKIYTASQQLEDGQSPIKDEHISKQRDFYKKLEIADKEKNLKVVLPVTRKEIVNEGTQLRHCVASYADRVADGATIIAFVRHIDDPETSYYTAEIDPITLNLIQLRGMHNCSPTPEVKAIVSKSIKRIKALPVLTN